MNDAVKNLELEYNGWEIRYHETSYGVMEREIVNGVSCEIHETVLEDLEKWVKPMLRSPYEDDSYPLDAICSMISDLGFDDYQWDSDAHKITFDYDIAHGVLSYDNGRISMSLYDEDEENCITKKYPDTVCWLHVLLSVSELFEMLEKISKVCVEW